MMQCRKAGSRGWKAELPGGTLRSFRRFWRPCWACPDPDAAPSWRARDQSPRPTAEGPSLRVLLRRCGRSGCRGSSDAGPLGRGLASASSSAGMRTVTEMILEQICGQFGSRVITQGDNWNLRGAQHSGVSQRWAKEPSRAASRHERAFPRKRLAQLRGTFPRKRPFCRRESASQNLSRSVDAGTVFDGQGRVSPSRLQVIQADDHGGGWPRLVITTRPCARCRRFTTSENRFFTACWLAGG
jgi:hypothetical protein